MARAMWTGSITFGLVSIPVGLYSATEDHTVHFHQVQRGTSDRIRNRRVNERTGKEVEYRDIVKAVEVGEGEQVVVDPEELNAVAPGRSQSIEISDFVTLVDIDPIYFNKTYWLAPANKRASRPYALLLGAMEETGQAAIGTLVMRGKEYLAAIRPNSNVLALETLFFADEVRDPEGYLPNLPERGRANGKELDMAISLVESMSTTWQPTAYHDSYQQRVADLIEDKRKGRETITEAEPPKPTEMSDLLAALERSVAARRKRGDDPESAERKKKPDAVNSGPDDASDSEREDQPDALSQLSKAQLLERAREWDIPGRSSMNRAQLVEALTEVETESSSRSA